MKHNTPVVTAANDYMKVDGSTAEYGADPALDEWAKGYRCWNTTTSARTPSATRAFLTPPSKEEASL